MNRRDFLKVSGVAIAAGTVLPSIVKAGLLTSVTEDNFSLEVITDQPEKASALLERFAKNGSLGTGNLSYAEYPIAESVVGDIVFVKNGKLFDLINSSSDLANGLKDIRKELKLPSLISNPVRVRMFRKSEGKAKEIFVMRKGEIIGKFDPNSFGTFDVTGRSGNTKISFSENGVRVLDSECKHKICAKMRAITKSGDFITCIPNQLHIFAE